MRRSAKFANLSWQFVKYDFFFFFAYAAVKLTRARVGGSCVDGGIRAHSDPFTANRFWNIFAKMIRFYAFN